MKRIIPFSRGGFLPLAAFFLTLIALPAEALDFKGRAPAINNLVYQTDQEILVDEVFSIRHKGDAVSFFVTFSAGTSGTTSSRTLTDVAGAPLYYNLFLSSSQRTILRAFTDNPSGSQVISGSFTAEEGLRGGTTKEYSFTFIIDPDQFPAAGTYSDVVALDLYEGTPEAPVPGGPVASLTFSLSVQVGVFTDLSLVTPGAGFDVTGTALNLNFGTLTAGSWRGADLLVRSNTLYSVSVSSAQGGRMVIVDPEDLSVVPYRLSVEGIEVDVSGGGEVPLGFQAGPSDQNGDRYPLVITILDYGMATEGLYTDTLTFTLSAP